jgi:hypothetical protein
MLQLAVAVRTIKIGHGNPVGRWIAVTMGEQNASVLLCAALWDSCVSIYVNNSEEAFGKGIVGTISSRGANIPRKS